MCTVVLRWVAGQPVSILALRDELVGREFDDPGRWWPELSDVVGGRDRVAGGTWAASSVSSGATALVLNRPERRVAAPGASSRGALPLLALQHDEDWPLHLDLVGMASFSLLLATPARLRHWSFDGVTLSAAELSAGTHLITSGGIEDGKATRHLAAFVAADPDRWPSLLEEPRDDLTALVVRHALPDRVFATVFGQLMVSRPGALEVSWSRTPWQPGWLTGHWPVASG